MGRVPVQHRPIGRRLRGVGTDAGSHRGQFGISEHPHQVGQPPLGHLTVAVHERHQLGRDRGEGVVAGGAGPAVDVTVQQSGPVAAAHLGQRVRVLRAVVDHDDGRTGPQRPEASVEGLTSVPSRHHHGDVGALRPVNAGGPAAFWSSRLRGHGVGEAGPHQPSAQSSGGPGGSRPPQPGPQGVGPGSTEDDQSPRVAADQDRPVAEGPHRRVEDQSGSVRHLGHVATDPTRRRRRLSANGRSQRQSAVHRDDRTGEGAGLGTGQPHQGRRHLLGGQ